VHNSDALRVQLPKIMLIDSVPSGVRAWHSARAAVVGFVRLVGGVSVVGGRGEDVLAVGNSLTVTLKNGKM